MASRSSRAARRASALSLVPPAGPAAPLPKLAPTSPIPFKPADAARIRTAYREALAAQTALTEAQTRLGETMKAGVRALGYDPDGDVKLNVDLVTMTLGPGA